MPALKTLEDLFVHELKDLIQRRAAIDQSLAEDGQSRFVGASACRF